MAQLSAEQNLTLADEYIKKGFAHAKAGEKTIAEWGAQYGDVKRAIEYLAEARRIDPSARLITTDAKSGSISTRSQDSLATDALYLAGWFCSVPDAGENIWNDGIAALTKAVKYSPKDARLYRQMGLINIRLKKRDDAIRNLKQALELDPTNSDIREMHDEITRDATVAVPPTWFEQNWHNINLLQIPAVIIGIILLFTSARILSFLFFAAAGWFYYKQNAETKKEKLALLQKAITGRGPGEFSQ